MWFCLSELLLCFNVSGILFSGAKHTRLNVTVILFSRAKRAHFNLSAILFLKA